MTLHDFYDLLDKELDAVIADNPKDENLHKGGIEQRKARAFLIWFLQFYGKKSDFRLDVSIKHDRDSYIIIFSTLNKIGKKLIYVVQSNWKLHENQSNPIDTINFEDTLDYFKLIYSNKIVFKHRTEYFYEHYKLVQRYLAENNQIKFVHLSIGQITPAITKQIEHFDKHTADIEVIDIERLMEDFVEVRYNKKQPQSLRE
jgi:hypothetical protein